MTLAATFARCSSCGRLLVRDALNPGARCARECGGRA